MAEDLGINVQETVKANESFGNISRKIAGVAGTLHVTQPADKHRIIDSAWDLSKSTGKPVVVVVRAQ